MSNKDLALRDDQDSFTEAQVAALTQIGVSRASKGDLQVFFHQAKRTGLDPFARQIYMIERAGKQTIQTSIDGFRIVAQRSGNYGGQTAPEWCGADGVWKDVWLEKNPPVAARIGVYYKDAPNPTYAVAKWDSYAQLSSPIWKKMPDLMLSKCAEALALRKAFPNDLSGLYTAEEMDQASTPKKVEAIAPAKTAVVIETTQEDLDTIATYMEEVSKAKNIEELRAIWNKASEKHLLEIQLDGTTLTDEINKYVADFKAQTEADVVDSE